MMLLMLAGLMPSRTAKRGDQCARVLFARRCSFAARFTFSELVDRIALAGAPQDRQQVDGRAAKPSMTGPPTTNRVKVCGTELRLNAQPGTFSYQRVLARSRKGTDAVR
jgi:hypothetical protein